MRKHETRNSVAGGPATRHARPRDGRRGVWAVLCRRQVYSIPAFGAKKVVKYPLPLSPLSQRGVTVLGDTGGSGGVSDLLSLRPSLRGIPSRQTIIGYRIASHKHRLSNVETVLGRSSLRASADHRPRHGACAQRKRASTYSALIGLRASSSSSSVFPARIGHFSRSGSHT